MSMHEDQLQISEDAVRRLVAEQFPQWCDRPVRAVATTGTMNAIFRIGDDLAARFPLLAENPHVVADGLEDEAAAARELAGATDVPTPEQVAIGRPGEGYPVPWGVQTWLPGQVATDEDPASSTAFADDLAGLIADLRRADVRGRRFGGAGRGGSLPDHDEWMATCFEESEDLLDVAPLRAMWADLRTLPSVDPDAMCHTDLTPSNILVRDGRLAGVLDCGGFAAADPALDLVGAWHLLDAVRREALRAALGCSEVQWRRGMAWSLQQSMGLVWYYAESNPTMSRWGRRTLDRLLGGAG
jgi:aminoglycoside phosphotransferase (APT) family kinase protein